MNFLKGRSVALLALGSLILAAVVAGGCASPKDSEKARFGSVIGTVTDSRGNPVAGAVVMVVDKANPNAIGTRNYDGYRGPFVTTSGGRFLIDGVLASGADTAVLNLSITKDGFLPTAATRTVSEATAVPGTNRVIPAGAQTVDIVVNSLAITDVVATLEMENAGQPVTPSGAEIRVEVPPTAVAPGVSVPAATPQVAVVRIPAGAVAATTAISVTPLPPTAAVLQPVIEASSPSTVVAPESTIVTTVSNGGVSLKPDGLTFPANARPTVRIPLGLSLTDLPVGTHLPVEWLNPTTNIWQKILTATVEAENGRPVAVFQVDHFSVYNVAIPVRYEFGQATQAFSDSQFRDVSLGVPGARWFGTLLASAPPAPPVTVNGTAWSPVAFPQLWDVGTRHGTKGSINGYFYSTGIVDDLTFPTATGVGQRDFLTRGFSQMSGQDAIKDYDPVTVPAGLYNYVLCRKFTYPVRATVFLSQIDSAKQDLVFDGTRTYWVQSSLTGTAATSQTPVNPSVITHVQGGGVEF